MSSFFKKYFSFKGRLLRSEYISFLAKLMIFTLPYFFYVISDLRNYKSFNVMSFDQFLTVLLGQPAAYVIANLLIITLLLILYLVAAVKRLHDIGLSGWVLLLSFLPSGEALYVSLALIPGTKGPNKYGPDPFESISSVER